jgi:hypothetical protein
MKEGPSSFCTALLMVAFHNMCTKVMPYCSAFTLYGRRQCTHTRLIRHTQFEAINLDRDRPTPSSTVPERPLSFSLAEVKKRRGGMIAVRSVTNLSSTIGNADEKIPLPPKDNYQIKRISKDDVERLSRGQPSKVKGYGSRGIPHRLNEEERAAFERAEVHGFITVEGNNQGYRRARKGSPLANIHRQWCDSRAKPQIMVSKASSMVNGQVTDHVLVDLSPLRCVGKTVLHQYETDLQNAATNAGMVLAVEDADDNQMIGAKETSDGDAEEADQETDIQFEIEGEEWATLPIWRLPTVSVGTFEGDRSRAKAMAKELAILWDISEGKKLGGGGGGAKNRKNAGAKGGGKTKTKGLSQHRRGRSGDGY